MITILACAECDVGLREWHSLALRARLIENRPYSTACQPNLRPPSEAPAQEGFPGRGARQLPRNRQLL